MDHLNWDDLRFARAVAEAGSARRAAAELRVSHQTVARRVAALEAHLGTKLFLRSAEGYLLTPAAEELVDLAAEFEGRIAGVTRRVCATNAQPAGTVRVALLDTSIPLLAPHFAAFCHEYPDIALDLVEGPQPVSFNRRDADVAIRFTADPPNALVGRRLAAVETAIYASTDYMSRRPADTDLVDHTWIGWSPPLDVHRPAQWMKRNVAGARVAATVNSFAAQLHLILAGLGVGILACLSGDAQPNLVRVDDAVLGSDGLSLWLLTHPDLRRSMRVRTFMDFISTRLISERDLIEGNRAR